MQNCAKLIGVKICFLIVLSTSPTLGDLVKNGSFEIPGPSNPTLFEGIGGGGLSASQDWTVFHNTFGSTETEQMLYSDALLPPIFPGDPAAGGDHVIRVEASHHGNGIVQVFSPPGTGPTSAYAEAWVYANSGVIGVGIGNGGTTQAVNFTTTVGQWEKLGFFESTSPVNEIVFYSIDGSAEFYVDLVSVQSVPEPGSGILILAAGAVSLLRRKRLV